MGGNREDFAEKAEENGFAEEHRVECRDAAILASPGALRGCPMMLFRWLWDLLLTAIGLILPERLLDADSPWHRRYDHWPRPPADSV